ncbi:MAG: hypothetical protein ACREBF_03225 [Candidatus Micrarchaeales archaeon]
MYPETAPITNPVADLYRNIENEPLIKKIKVLENNLMEVRASEKESLAQHLGDIEDKVLRHQNQNAAEHHKKKEQEREIMKELLSDFTELLKTPYGPLGYLVSSTSEGIIHLYGIDTDNDYYFKLKGNVFRVPNKKLDEMVAAGGGFRFVGERGVLVHNPSETPSNAKVTDHAIQEIIEAIQQKLSQM